MRPSFKTGFYAPGRGERAAHPELWDGCVRAYYAGLGETGKTFRDYSVLDRHAVIGGAQEAQAWTTVRGHVGLTFYSPDMTCTTSDSGLPMGDVPRTVLVWFRGTTYPGVLATLIDWGTWAGGQLYYIGIYLSGDIFIGNYGAQWIDGASRNILDGQWHSLVVRTSGPSGSQSTSVFIDGTIVSSPFNLALLPVSDGVQEIGTWTASVYYFTGGIGEIRVYDRAISDREMMLLSKQQGTAFARRTTVYGLPPAPTTRTLILPMSHATVEAT